MTGALPFSDQRERLPFLVIQRVQRAIAILLRQFCILHFAFCISLRFPTSSEKLKILKVFRFPLSVLRLFCYLCAIIV